MRDLVDKTEVLMVYADLYDVFDDNKAICKELRRVYDKLNGLPKMTCCKNCKHWFAGGLIDHDKYGAECVVMKRRMRSDDYCSYAERKIDE